MIDIEFQGNPLNARRDTAEKVLSSSTMVPFIIEQLRPNLQVL